MITILRLKVAVPTRLDFNHCCILLSLCVGLTALPQALPGGDTCPSAEWSVMCRPCCEYQLIQCRCPSEGSRVGYTVPCCRNAVDQCDPCIIHPGCSLFENCKTCHNGTWKANDNFFVNGKYCTECRQGWSGGGCKTCGGVIQRPQGHVALEGYPTNARCEWTVQVTSGSTVELRFTLLSLESDHSCRYDYVEVRDGADLSSPVIGRFCGDELPPPLKSSGNHLHILFISDGYNNFDGFVLTFQEISGRVVKNPACPPPEKPANGDSFPTYDEKEELRFVNYRCHPPFTLTGPQQRTCLPNGTWTGSAPTCLKGQTRTARCPSPPKLLNGFQRPALEAAAGAETIEFSCKKSYILSGNHRSTCLSNGSWSSSPPECVKACREPRVSELVQQSVVSSAPPSRYNMHDLLSAGFLPLPLDRQSSGQRGDSEGEKLPGGFHRVYTSIEYKCASALYRHAGSPRRTCLTTGRWSGRHVSCSPVCGKFNTSSTRNLSDTLWPWHAAVYVRSPPDDTSSTHRPRGAATLGHQGTSEESTFWYLACSGALLTQHSILVTAECVVDKQQPLHPAHVKVVIGTQHQASKGPLRDLHHLRVAEVLLHPAFSSAPDSNVALLKLKDKARISQHVLPVCLPKTQGEEVTVQQAYASRWILTNSHRHLSRRAPWSQTELVELSDVVLCGREGAGGGANGTATSALCVTTKPSGPRSSCPGVAPGLTAAPAGLPPTTGASLSGHEETRGTSNGDWQLLGLESFSFKGKNCHERTHTVQVRVANFKEWIEKNMK